MSAENNVDVDALTTDMCCANCGKAEIDDIKLKPCDRCDLVKYCSDECREEHRLVHEDSCRERAALLRDKLLFKQPEISHLGDCPICCLPMPYTKGHYMGQLCCCQSICKGCVVANGMRQARERQEHTCLFCRTLHEEVVKDPKKFLRERAKANDPFALRELGFILSKEGDIDNALAHTARAAELGDADAHFNLTIFDTEMEEKKRIFHLEEASILGHPNARCNLAQIDFDNGRITRAVTHIFIAAKFGHERAIGQLKDCYKCGGIRKENYAKALRGYQDAVNAMKSPQRDQVIKAMRRMS